MQVSVDSTGPLERRLQVEIPEQRIADEVDSRLRELSRTTRIAGFRPGKVPFRVVAQRFGRQVRDEVVGQVLQQSLSEAVSEQNLHPAGQPRIDPLQAEPGEGLRYTATFEVYPEVSLDELSSVGVEVPVSELSDDDVDAMVERLRQQRTAFEPVEREAREGDQVTIDFQGTIGGEPFEGGSAEGYVLRLGSGQVLPEFDAAISGHRAGDEVTAEVTFPEDYHASQLAGRTAEFRITVREVAEPKVPEVDAEFARAFGVEDGDVERFRSEVRENMQRELEQRLRQATKEALMDALYEAIDVPLPKALVQTEQMRMHQEMAQRMAMSRASPEAIERLRPEMFEAQARRRVALGLIIAEAVRRAGLSADPQAVRARVEALAAGYEQPEEVVKWYYAEPARVAEIESSVLEDEATQWLLGQVSTSEKRVPFDALMNPGQTATEASAEG